MDEVCTCKVCGGQRWIISKEYIQCYGCKKKHRFSQDTPANALVNLTNDNF